jgi:Xaa-Pro aminopeptidase
MNIILSGSAGTAVITTDKALLFTDGRYHNQAEIELGSEWTLMKQGTKGFFLLAL